MLGSSSVRDSDGLLSKSGGDGVGEVLGAVRVGLGNHLEQAGLRGRSHALGAAELFDDGEALFGGQPWSDNALQCGMDLCE